MRLRHRQLLLLLGAALVAAILVALGGFSLVRSSLRERSVERIGAETALLAEWVQGVEGTAALQAFSERASARLDLRVTLIAADGTVIADSATGPDGLAQMDNHLGRPEVQAARLRGRGSSYRRSDTTSVRYFYSACRVAGEGPVEYTRVALPASRIDRLEARYAWMTAGVVLLSMLLFSGVAYAAVRRFSYPVERMAAAVKRCASGDDALELPRGGGREIDDLAESVRTMRRAMAAKLEELDTQHSLLSSVVSGMREGLLLIGPDRRVRLANGALIRILDLTLDPRGRLLEEVVRHPAVLNGVEEAFSGAGETRESILRVPATGRAFELHVTPLKSTGGAGQGVLVLFLDITRLEKLETVRREFVANVSHELRTPLTSIMAFVENMLDGGAGTAEEAQRFLGIISKHADRMSALIDDLTDLSLIETGAVRLELRRLDAAPVVREVVEQLRPQAAERQVEIATDLPGPVPLVADRRRLEQMLINLIGNAIKFNREGGEIHVRAVLKSEETLIRIEDTGIGIAAESLEKIFNRFYRAQRERPADVGGTGLGLAIVKHLMRLHGGSVGVESELGRGSTFRLSFPQQHPGSGNGLS
jgi:two-component system phosphate regulon sensor histidine kinase PhoR